MQGKMIEIQRYFCYMRVWNLIGFQNIKIIKFLLDTLIFGVN